MSSCLVRLRVVSVLVLELDGEQFGDQIVGWILLAPFDVLGEHLTVK